MLVPVNWALESLKWQRLARKAVPVTFREAFRGTLTGLAIGVAAPAQLGDTIGRVASLRSHDRLKAIGAALVSNGIQFYVSIIGGGIGLLWVGKKLGLDPMTRSVLNVLLIVLILLAILIVFFRRNLTTWKTKKVFLSKMLSYFQIIGQYSGRRSDRSNFVWITALCCFFISIRPCFISFRFWIKLCKSCLPAPHLFFWLKH